MLRPALQPALRPALQPAIGRAGRRGGGASSPDVVLLSATLNNTTTPQIGTATTAYARTYAASRRKADLAWEDIAANVVPYTWDFENARWVYKQCGGRAYPSTLFNRSRNLTHADWTKVNVSALKDVIGIDGVSNSASRLTASAADGTAIIDLGTIASAERTTAVWLRRITGTGKVYLTRNGGSAWTELTGITTDWQVFQLTSTLANPDIGIKIETSGDVIGVDCWDDHAGKPAGEPMLSFYVQGAGSLIYSSISPAINVNGRIKLDFRCRRRGPLDPSVRLDGGSGVTVDGIALDLRPDGIWRASTYSNSLGQYAAQPAGQPATAAGEDCEVTMMFGGGALDLLVNGVVTTPLDLTGKVNPRDLVRLYFAGDGEFSNVVLSQMASKNLCLAGDSITAAAYYPAKYRANLDPLLYSVIGRGVGGDTIADMEARITSAIDPCFIAGARENVCVVWIGTNTLVGATSAEDALIELADCITAIRSVKAWDKIVALPVLPRGIGAAKATFEAKRLVYNAGLIAAGADATVSFEGIPEIQYTDNLMWFDSFKVHPTPPLYDLLWPVIRPAVI